MTCGNLYAECVHRSGRRRPHPNLLTQTADKSSAEFTREKSHQLKYANMASGIPPPGPLVYLCHADKQRDFLKFELTNNKHPIDTVF